MFFKMGSEGKAVLGFAVEFFSGLYEGLLPFRMVHGVGIELGLQSHAAAETVVYALLAGLIGVIGGVHLDAGQVRGDGQVPAAAGICQGGCGGAEYLKIVVDALLQLQRLKILPQRLTDGLGYPEVHGGARHLRQIPCGDALGIGQGEAPGRQAQELVHGLFRPVMACQVEVAVVGEIKYRVPVADGTVADPQAVGFHGVGHIDGGISREALVPVGAQEPEMDGSRAVAHHSPKSGVVALEAAVETVFSVVGIQAVGVIAKDKGGVLDPVGVAAHGGSKVGAAAQIALRAVKAQHHICGNTIPVRYKKLYQGSAQIGYLSGQLATRYGVQIGLLPLGQWAKVFFHIL